MDGMDGIDGRVDRYLTERKMPDKAIDLVDEAASRLRLQQESKPEPIWRLEREVMRKMIEIEALKKETDQVRSFV